MSSSYRSDRGRNRSNHNKQIRAHLVISGKVQGVYFRHNTQLVASRHNVMGWVRNLEDGRLEVVLEGGEVEVRDVIEWCRIGPSGAKVEDISMQYEDYMGEFKDFKVVF